MYRKIKENLLFWKESRCRKPLLLEGARQVGKTYTVLEFGKENYENVAYFNFENRTDLNECFSKNISPSFLIPILSSKIKQTIIKEKTLIVFDEVQLCERALTSLKYFSEEAPEYHIIALGSLPGVALNREKYSFPVGKVDMLKMYPMDEEEFILSLGENGIVDGIKESFQKNKEFSFHDEAMRLYREYLVVGGMPEAVKIYKETRDFNLVRNVQKFINTQYLNDMSKYNTSAETKKAKLTYENITVQLSKKNTRFQYKLIKEGARAREFENAIEHLILSGIFGQVYKVDQGYKPLRNFRDINSFKLFSSDIGLLNSMNETFPEDILYMDNTINNFKGGMTENCVYLALESNGYTPYYWESERGAEVDFLIQKDGEIIPIEVKSADNMMAKSLRVYIERFKPNYSIKIGTKNFDFVNNIKTIPLYAAFCI